MAVVVKFCQTLGSDPNDDVPISIEATTRYRRKSVETQQSRNVDVSQWNAPAI